MACSPESAAKALGVGTKATARSAISVVTFNVVFMIICLRIGRLMKPAIGQNQVVVRNDDAASGVHGRGGSKPEMEPHSQEAKADEAVK